MKKPETICVFGDSTAWGAWDMEKAGWVNRLWMDLNNGEGYVQLYNQSISGGTSKKILARFEKEAQDRKAEALIFQTGGNDASFWGSTKKPLVSLADFESNIREILIRAKQITDKIICIDLKNCIESKTTPVSWIDLHFTNAMMEQYGAVMRKVCDEQQIPFLDIAPLDETDFDVDGLHPNASGHQKIYLQVKDFLANLGWI